MQKYRFKEGDEVAHKENISLMMTIKRILKESTSFPTGKQEEDGTPIKRQGTKMIGIECHWWVEKNLRVERFHSRELIPWVTALKGREEVIRWLKIQQDIKN